MTVSPSNAPGMPRSQWKDFEHPERYPHYLDSYVDQMRYRGFRQAILATMRNYLTRMLQCPARLLDSARKKGAVNSLDSICNP